MIERSTALRLPALVWLLLLLAVVTYGFGLGSVDIPSNGDEHVYLHIAGRTAASGHWLPLQSDLVHTRNTKPPLLFWQAIATGGLGDASLAAVRAPSVAYTFGTTALVLLTLWRLGAGARRAALGALLYLACYSVYRYGRPLLTDAPETFWLSLLVLPVALRSARAPMPRLWTWVAWGLAAGFVALYKSFVLLVPIGLFLLLAVSPRRPGRAVPALAGAALVGCVGLAMFCLWPLLDPQPQAIWQEFVIGENAGKLGNWQDYLHGLWAGGNSVPGLFGALLLDGGVLAPLLLGAVILGIRSRRQWSDAERTLWLWVLVLFLFFAIPSQRSGRYLLPALPALAVLVALRAEQIGRGWSRASAGLVIVVAAVFAALTFMVGREPGSPIQPGVIFYALCVIALGLALASVIHARWAVVGPAGGSIALMLAMAVFLRSYDRPPGPFEAAVRDAVRGQAVMVPCDFVASEEAYRYLLPGSEPRSYNLHWNLTTAELAATNRYFVVRTALADLPACDQCERLGSRPVIHGRLGPGEWRDLLHGHVLAHLLQRDWLLRSPAAAQSALRPPSACTPEGEAAHRAGGQ